MLKKYRYISKLFIFMGYSQIQEEGKDIFKNKRIEDFQEKDLLQIQEIVNLDKNEWIDMEGK